MLPLYKVLSLFFRVFSKPLINLTKQYHTRNQIQSDYIRKFFIFMGNKYHRFENFINRRYLKVNSEFAYKPLNSNVALEKGIQFFYQILFYTIVIGFPVYQMYRANQQSQQKSKIMNQRLKRIDEKSKQLKNKVEDLIRQRQAHEKFETTLSSSSRFSVTNLMLNQQLEKKGEYCLPQPIRLYYSPNFVKEYRLCLL